MLTATEAREKTKQAQIELTIKELEKAYTLIQKAAEEGKTEITMRGLMYIENQNKLKEQGYKFDWTLDFLNTPYTIISWEE